MSTDVEALKTALATVVDPNTGVGLVAGGAVARLAVEQGVATAEIVLGYPAKSSFELLRAQVAAVLVAQPGVTRAEVTVSSKIVAHTVQRGVPLLPGVKNIIAVASAKGGVGKSTTAVNLALALAAEGAAVGILDADIYGPSVPLLLGLNGQPTSADGKTMEPMIGYGLQANSIGLIVDPDSPMVWRGPMVTQALEQLLRQTNWHDLDYLVIDMPPGTGDIQLTLAQKVPVTGAVVVTTPQDLALADARRGHAMFDKVGIPVLGIVENMSVYVCPNCGHQEHLFGTGGAQKMGADFDVDVLGQLPLNATIRADADAGKPTVAADPDGALAAIYRTIAIRVAVAIAAKARDLSAKFPKIVIQNS